MVEEDHEGDGTFLTGFGHVLGDDGGEENKPEEVKSSHQMSHGASPGTTSDQGTMPHLGQQKSNNANAGGDVVPNSLSAMELSLQGAETGTENECLIVSSDEHGELGRMISPRTRRRALFNAPEDPAKVRQATMMARRQLKAQQRSRRERIRGRYERRGNFDLLSSGEEDGIITIPGMEEQNVDTVDGGGQNVETANSLISSGTTSDKSLSKFLSADFPGNATEKGKITALQTTPRNIIPGSVNDASSSPFASALSPMRAPDFPPRNTRGNCYVSEDAAHVPYRWFLGHGKSPGNTLNLLHPHYGSVSCRLFFARANQWASSLSGTNTSATFLSSQISTTGTSQSHKALAAGPGGVGVISTTTTTTSTSSSNFANFHAQGEVPQGTIKTGLSRRKLQFFPRLSLSKHYSKHYYCSWHYYALGVRARLDALQQPLPPSISALSPFPHSHHACLHRQASTRSHN